MACVAIQAGIDNFLPVDYGGRGGVGPWKFLIFHERSATTEATEHVSARLWKVCGRPADGHMGTADFTALPIHSAKVLRDRDFLSATYSKQAYPLGVAAVVRLPLP